MTGEVEEKRAFDRSDRVTGLLAGVCAAVGGGVGVRISGSQPQGVRGHGSANNWTRQRRFCGAFVPILDFIHALSYVFAAAQAGRKFVAGGVCSRQWIGRVWQGKVAQVLETLRTRQEELGRPGECYVGQDQPWPRSGVT